MFFCCLLRVSISLAPDQARRLVGPDLGPNCLPMLLEDDTCRQCVNFEYQSQVTETEKIACANETQTIRAV